MAVGMNKEKNIAASLCRTGVHLPGTAALGPCDEIRVRTSDCNRVVAAATIDDDILDARVILAQHRFDRRLDKGGLIERRSDD